MHPAALLLLQVHQVAEAAGGLSPDAKWILISLAGGVVMIGGFLGRITFALLPSAREALLGVAKLPGAIDGVKDELAAVKVGMGHEMHEVRTELQRLGLGFESLAQEVRDRRVSDMAKTSAAALALAQGTLPDNPLPDLDDEPTASSGGARSAAIGRAPRPRPASSPALEASAARSSRPR